MVSKTRAIRIADRMREDLMEILLWQSRDPRLSGLSVTEVRVDRELAFADIYVCTIEGTQRAGDVLTALDHAQGFLRSELSRRIQLRSFPKLRFHWDLTFERADAIERIISDLHREETLKSLSNNSEDNTDK